MKIPPSFIESEEPPTNVQNRKNYLLLNLGILHFLDDIGGLCLTFLQMPWPYCVYPVYLSHLSARIGAKYIQHYKKIIQIHSNNTCQIYFFSILLKLTDFNQVLFFSLLQSKNELQIFFTKPSVRAKPIILK